MTVPVTISWVGTTGQTYYITLDVASKLQHTSTNQVTDHPVETGANISDHVRPDPDVLTVEGVISNTPILLPSDHAGSAQETTETVAADWSGFDNRRTVRGAERTIGDIAPVPRLFGGIGIGGGQSAQIGRQVPGGSLAANVKVFTEEFDRVGECYLELREVRDTGTLCSVLTHRWLYDNMAITQLDVTDDGQTGHALRFTVAFKQVRFGATKSEPVPVKDVPRKKVPAGKKQPVPPPIPVEPEGKGSISSKALG